ncbi:MAG: hypothetical protein Q7K29_07940, partial [Thermoleophilia bacterium]|nr:hypothetical protein [Thermoleophilia bacterium]
TSETGAWNCSNCWKCEESCPVGVDIYDVMMKKRREEEAPAQYRRSYERICETGYSFPVEEINTIREMWGLRKVRLADPEKVRRLLADRDKSSEKL